MVTSAPVSLSEGFVFASVDFFFTLLEGDLFLYDEGLFVADGLVTELFRWNLGGFLRSSMAAMRHEERFQKGTDRTASA